LGIGAPWAASTVEFDEAAKLLTVLVDFRPGTRFAISGHAGQHPVHDTVPKTYRHLNFFQHDCHLQVRTPRVKLPNGLVRLVEPDFAGRLSGFTLLFEALILMLAQQMPLAAVTRIVGESPTASWPCAGATCTSHWAWPTSARFGHWPSTRNVSMTLLHRLS
jgi:transposase